MRLALSEAEDAFRAGEVPIGAVLVRDGQVLARARNRVEETNDASAHAEMLALRSAARALGSWRLDDATLYTTLEPCPMCLPALAAFRVDRVVYGARNTRLGAIESAMSASTAPHPYHTVDVEAGVLSEACSTLVRDFFRRRRAENNSVDTSSPTLGK
jgi:tRNA(adenine34) deaminase